MDATGASRELCARRPEVEADDCRLRPAGTGRGSRPAWTCRAAADRAPGLARRRAVAAAARAAKGSMLTLLRGGSCAGRW